MIQYKYLEKIYLKEWVVMIYSQNVDGTFTIKKLNVVVNGVEKKFKNINFNTLDDLQNFLSQF